MVNKLCTAWNSTINRSIPICSNPNKSHVLQLIKFDTKISVFSFLQRISCQERKSDICRTNMFFQKEDSWGFVSAHQYGSHNFTPIISPLDLIHKNCPLKNHDLVKQSPEFIVLWVWSTVFDSVFFPATSPFFRIIFGSTTIFWWNHAIYRRYIFFLCCLSCFLLASWLQAEESKASVESRGNDDVGWWKYHHICSYIIWIPYGYHDNEGDIPNMVIPNMDSYYISSLICYKWSHDD